MMSIGATGSDGEYAFYSSIGTNIHVSAPGGDEKWDGHMVTPYPGSDQCTNGGMGTSYACPIVAGVVALMLEANADLTWRDVQHILANTSTMVLGFDDDDHWVVNAAGFHHSIKYGFGLVNATAAVLMALEMEASNSQALIAIEQSETRIVPGGGDLTYDMEIPSNASFMLSVEHVVLYVTMYGDRVGDVSVSVTSPQNTTSELLWNTHADSQSLILSGHKLMTLQFWGEIPHGNWDVRFEAVDPSEQQQTTAAYVENVVLAVYGKCEENSTTTCRRVIGVSMSSSTDNFGGIFDQAEYESGSPGDERVNEWCASLEAQGESTKTLKVNQDIVCDDDFLPCDALCDDTLTVALIVAVSVAACSCVTCTVALVACYCFSRKNKHPEAGKGIEKAEIEL